MIKIDQLYKTYRRGAEPVEALRGISMEINRGEFVVILGPSGGGKSTLLNLMGGVDRPTSGSIYVNGFELGSASEENLTRFRRDHIGFIFQFYNLLSALSAVENVALPLMAKRNTFQVSREKAAELLSRLGLEKRLNHLPSELSGGEQQRVAIARAIIGEPTLVLADEPTGDLDSHTADEIINLMHGLNEQMHLTFVIATHNQRLAEKAHRVIQLRDGRIDANNHLPAG